MSSHSKQAIPLHRLENFSDAVFAFAVTLLVVSLEVPKTAEEFLHNMRGTIAFGVCFAMLIGVWFQHSRYFRHYPLSDVRAVVLNMLLLFTVLTYVYPMRFLFGWMADYFIFGKGNDTYHSNAEAISIMLIFGLGIFAVNAVFYLMHRHAASQRAQLNLDSAQALELKRATITNVLVCLIALLSMSVAWFARDAGQISGPVYALIGPARFLAAWLAKRTPTQPAGT